MSRGLEHNTYELRELDLFYLGEGGLGSMGPNSNHPVPMRKLPRQSQALYWGNKDHKLKQREMKQIKYGTSLGIFQAEQFHDVLALLEETK